MYWISKSIHWTEQGEAPRADPAGRGGARHHHHGGRQRRRRHLHLCPNRRQDGLQPALGLHHPRADGLLRSGDDRPPGRGHQARPCRGHLRRLRPLLGLVLHLRPGVDQLADAGDRVHRHDPGHADLRHPRMAHLPGRHPADVRHRDVGQVLDLREDHACSSACSIWCTFRPPSGPCRPATSPTAGSAWAVDSTATACCGGPSRGGHDHARHGQHRHDHHPLADLLPAVGRGRQGHGRPRHEGSARSTPSSARF